MNCSCCWRQQTVHLAWYEHIKAMLCSLGSHIINFGLQKSWHFILRLLNVLNAKYAVSSMFLKSDSCLVEVSVQRAHVKADSVQQLANLMGRSAISEWEKPATVVMTSYTESELKQVLIGHFREEISSLIRLALSFPRSVQSRPLRLTIFPCGASQKLRMSCSSSPSLSSMRLNTVGSTLSNRTFCSKPSVLLMASSTVARITRRSWSSFDNEVRSSGAFAIERINENIPELMPRTVDSSSMTLAGAADKGSITSFLNRKNCG